MAGSSSSGSPAPVATSSSRSTISSHEKPKGNNHARLSVSTTSTSSPFTASTSTKSTSAPTYAAPATAFSLPQFASTSSSSSNSTTRSVVGQTRDDQPEHSSPRSRHNTSNKLFNRNGSNTPAPRMDFVSPKAKTPEVIQIDDSDDGLRMQVDQNGDDDDDEPLTDLEDDEDEGDDIQIVETKANRDGITVKKARMSTTNDEPGKKIYCHQDHQAHDSTKLLMLTCSAAKTTLKGQHRQCSLSFCTKCLKSRYDEDAAKIKASGSKWACPSCRGICNCSIHRKKQNLPPIGKPLANGSSSNSKPSHKDSGISSNVNGKGRAEGSNSKPFARLSDASSLSVATSNPDKPKKPKSAHDKLQNGHGNTKPTVRGPFTMDVDSDSSLSSLSSDDEGKKSGLSAVTLSTTAASKRRKPPPRAPKHVRAPQTYPLSRSTLIPSTGLLLARLHLRSFILRFNGFAPVLTSESAKIRSVLGALADDRDGWVWGKEGDMAQRFMLQALCELIDSEEEAISSAEGVPKLLRRLGREAVGNQAEKDRAWETLQEILEEEEVWEDGGWGDEIAKWEAEREEAELVQFGGIRETRARKGDMSPDSRLAMMLALVELAYSAECVRKDFLEGVEAERTAMVTNQKNLSQTRHEWEDRRKELMAEKTLKPKLPVNLSPSKKSTAKADHDREVAEWVAKCAEIEEKVREEEKEHQKEVNEIYRDIHVVTTENRLRFAPVGNDYEDNEYWFLSPSTASKFPIGSDPADDDYPLSWSILIHGAPFSDVDPNLAVNGKHQQPPPSPPPTPGTVAAHNSARAEDKDAWFVITDPEEMDQLVHHLEWQSKNLDYELRKLRHEKTEAGLRELTAVEVDEVEEEGDSVKDISELIAQLKVFAGYVAAEREDALNGSRKTRKLKKRRF